MIYLQKVVELIEGAPNAMFPEAITSLLRFYRMFVNGKQAAFVCAECGKKRRKGWTMICSFQAKSMGAFTLVSSGKVHDPFTPVCEDHPLAPEVTE